MSSGSYFEPHIQLIVQNTKINIVKLKMSRHNRDQKDLLCFAVTMRSGTFDKCVESLALQPRDWYFLFTCAPNALCQQKGTELVLIL